MYNVDLPDENWEATTEKEYEGETETTGSAKVVPPGKDSQHFINKHKDIEVIIKYVPEEKANVNWEGLSKGFYYVCLKTTDSHSIPDFIAKDHYLYERTEAEEIVEREIKHADDRVNRAIEFSEP